MLHYLIILNVKHIFSEYIYRLQQKTNLKQKVLKVGSATDYYCTGLWPVRLEIKFFSYMNTIAQKNMWSDVPVKWSRYNVLPSQKTYAHRWTLFGGEVISNKSVFATYICKVESLLLTYPIFKCHAPLLCIWCYLSTFRDSLFRYLSLLVHAWSSKNVPF